MKNTKNPNEPHPIANDQSPSYEEEEINLLDLLLVILKHKKLIFFSVFFAAILAVVISLNLPNIYRSEATIALRTEDSSDSISSLSGLGGLGSMVAGQLGLGGNEGLEKLKVTLNSRDLTRRVVEKHDLMPILFEEEWDQDKKGWKNEEFAPTIQDAWKLILNGLLKVNVNQDSKTIDIGFEHKNPEFSKKMVKYYIAELSNVLRQEVLYDSIEKKKFFKKQIEKIKDSLLREKIYSLLAKEIEKETFAKAQKYYGFLLIDPPIIPDQNKKIKPKRFNILLLAIFLSFFFSVFLSFIIEYTNRLKSEDPERYYLFKNGIKLWGKKEENLKL